MADNAVEVRGLDKSFGARRKWSRSSSVRALDGVDLDIPVGAIAGILGPNGAGKTTMVRILTTLLSPDEGSVRVAGEDVVASPARVRRRIGLSGQYAAVDENLTGFENLTMVGRLYGLPRGVAAARARELLGRFRLDDASERRSGGYSGGMRRRLDLAGALVARPAVVVLDEPTTGLDPRGRRDMWEVIEGLADDGTTVLLTTQYLEEADRLADSITMIDRGKVVARGTPTELKSRIGGDLLTIEVGPGSAMPTAAGVLAWVGVGRPQVDGRVMAVRVRDGTRSLADAVSRLTCANIRVDDAALRQTTLDDFFLAVTGDAAPTGEGCSAGAVHSEPGSERAPVTS